MNQFEKVLQQIVLAVNRWPLGVHLTKTPYYLAVLLFKWLLHRHPLILAAYARNSYALGTWIPGLSDVDLTVILRAGGSPQAEYACVLKFRKNYASLQRWFPMLGEVEIINEAHLDAWTGFTITGYESRYWLHLYGKELISTTYQGDEEQRQRDRLNHAINIYRYLMAPAIGKASQQTLTRYVKKILRYLDESIIAVMEADIAKMRPERLQATVIQKLESAVIAQSTTPVDGKVKNLDTVLAKTVVASVHHGALSPIMTDDFPVKDILDSVLRSANDPNIIYCVPKSGLDIDQLEKFVTTINPDAGTPVIMPRKVLVRYLECIDPLDHLALMQDRTLLWGSDPLHRPEPLFDTVLMNAVCTYSTHILLAPYQTNLEMMGSIEFRNLLFGWILRTARFFEDGVMDFDDRRLYEYWCRSHPGDKPELQADKLDGGLRRFVLLRRFADRISACMLSASISPQTGSNNPSSISRQ